MKKFLAILLIAVLGLFGCAHVRHGSVNKSIEKIYYSSVSILNEKNVVAGSGTIIVNGVGKYITVVTAAHVIKGLVKRGAKKIHIFSVYDGLYREVMIYKIDNELDLALLISVTKEHKDGPYVNIAHDSPNIGDRVHAIGSPLGDKNTVTDGIISRFEEVSEKFPRKRQASHYRFTAPIFFGNSGGGLFNDQSELIGVVVSIQTIGIGFSVIVVPGAAFAVSVESLRDFL